MSQFTSTSQNHESYGVTFNFNLALLLAQIYRVAGCYGSFQRDFASRHAIPATMTRVWLLIVLLDWWHLIRDLRFFSRVDYIASRVREILQEPSLDFACMHNDWSQNSSHGQVKQSVDHDKTFQATILLMLQLKLPTMYQQAIGAQKSLNATVSFHRLYQ